MAMIDRDTVQQLCLKGESNRDIARRVGCATNTIAKIRRDLVDRGLLPADHKQPNPFATVPPRYPQDPEDDEDDEFADDDELEDIEDLDDADDVLDLGQSDRRPKISTSVDDAKSRAAERILEVRQRRAELEIAKIDRELAQLALPATPPVHDSAGGDGQLFALMMHQLQSSQAQTTALMQQLLTIASRPPAPAAQADLSNLLQLVEFVDQLRGSQEPTDPLSSMLAMASRAMDRGGFAPGAAPGVPPADRAGLPPEATPPQSDGRARTTGWLNVVMREMSNGSDPRAIAGHVRDMLGILPGPVRSVILEQPLEAMVPVLRRHVVDPSLVDELVSRVRGDDSNATWLGELLQELRYESATTDDDEVLSNGQQRQEAE